MNDKAIDPRARIGHVHLKVANLQRALDFYCGVLGFELTQRYGEEAALDRKSVGQSSTGRIQNRK